jgi:hypothetical protein
MLGEWRPVKPKRKPVRKLAAPRIARRWPPSATT